MDPYIPYGYLLSSSYAWQSSVFPGNTKSKTLPLSWSLFLSPAPSMLSNPMLSSAAFTNATPLTRAQTIYPSITSKTARSHPFAAARRPDVSVITPTTYDDGPLAQFAISVFRRIMRPEIGWTSPRPGYDGLIEECRMLLARKGPAEQQRVVRKTLDTLFQYPTGPTIFRSRFAHPRLNAVITPTFFSWLVGPCQTNRPPEGGYGVKIDKCRFLEESGCKGLCVNMCQQPTQAYFTEVLGLPVRMTPDYDTLGCQMSFGASPLPLEEDPAITGDCFANCKMSSSVKLRETTCYVTKDSR